MEIRPEPASVDPEQATDQELNSNELEDLSGGFAGGGVAPPPPPR